MNVREDLLTDLVATLYKDNARIKQLEAIVEQLRMYRDEVIASPCWDLETHEVRDRLTEILKPEE